MAVGPSGGYFAWFKGLAPAWFQGEIGGLYLQTKGIFRDLVAEGFRQATKAHFPDFAAPDGLDALGEERELPRFEVLGHESDSHYAARLKNAWADAAHRGTRTGLALILNQLGFPDAKIYDHHELAQPGDPWSWGWIYLPTNPWKKSPAWGTGKWGSGVSWGSTATAEQVSNLRAVLKPWIPANNRFWVVLSFASVKWGTKSWGTGMWGGENLYWEI